MVKKLLRQQVRETLTGLNAQTMARKSAAAAELLVSTQEWRNSEVVMVFLALPTEIDTTAAVLRAWQEHKRVLAPRVSWEQRRMMPIEIRSLTSNLTETSLGVREPVAGAPIPLEIIDLVIVPGLAFDAAGNRLGRGRGFYDRFLAHPEFAGTACALAFEEQVVPEVPVEAQDRPVHMLVTDVKVRRFHTCLNDRPGPRA